VAEPWEKVQVAAERGKGVCWRATHPGNSAPALHTPILTACGLTRPRYQVMLGLWQDVQCKACRSTADWQRLGQM
jgi:hypothetical protein